VSRTSPSSRKTPTPASVSAIFWVETVEDATGGTFLQLQYTQTVLLNFQNLSWPHVTVATLVKTF
jgi:hypothetical protein